MEARNVLASFVPRVTEHWLTTFQPAQQQGWADPNE